MAGIPLVANPLLPPVPDEPKNLDPEYQKTADQVWQWMKDLTLQMKILFGSPQASNSALTLPLVQPGMMTAFGGPTANIPSGYLSCDGSQFSQTQYAALYQAIGSTWNTGGEAAGNFRVPDLRGRDLVGAGAGAGLSARVLGQLGGEESHLLVKGEIPALDVTDPGHGHGATDPGHKHFQAGVSQGIASGAGGNGPFEQLPGTPGTSISTSTNTTGITINSATTGISVAGGGGSHNNMQPFACVTWIIKY